MDVTRARWTMAPLLGLFSVALSAMETSAPNRAVNDRQPFAVDAGGTLSHGHFNQSAFAMPAPGLSAAELRQFAIGNRLFNTRWITAPASVAQFDGLGPTFNRNSCSGCHVRDGRGQPPSGPNATLESALLRISLPGPANADPVGVPGYGTQLNDRAIAGVPAEGRVRVQWVEISGRYADGEGYRLRYPTLEVVELAFGALPSSTLYSLRVAPAVFGLGLLEAVSKETLVSLADPDDLDGDGISGRINWINGVDGERLPGRFGWKATSPNLRVQTAEAALNDIGITTTLLPMQNCPTEQVHCGAQADGGNPEMDDRQLDRLVDYLHGLGVPNRRDRTPADVREGERLFGQFGCSNCHLPSLSTGADRALPKNLRNQQFAAYTDLLLHDMGEGLADHRPEREASGREWRTAPLWGLGLIERVNAHLLLLHDGRARGIAEAILWHGGEAEAARERFRLAPRSQRLALIRFLESL